MFFSTTQMNNAEVLRPFRRDITVAFHDIDGTHSLIRDWPPVMSRVLYDVIENGMPGDPEGEENISRLASLCGTCPLEETDRFCVESAGLSALTQMEWALRRREEITRGPHSTPENTAIIRRIWEGEERFDDMPEDPAYTGYLKAFAPVLFRVYEKTLNRYCRDRNLNEARRDPEKYLVPGSREFIRRLRSAGVKNYFITGAVVDKTADPPVGMYEEVLALGFEVGEGREIEDVIGSTWDEKIPKDEVMLRLAERLGVSGENVLVVGDGRSEISAGVKFGAATLSRLPRDAVRQRELHRELGTDVIIENFVDIF